MSLTDSFRAVKLPTCESLILRDSSKTVGKAGDIAAFPSLQGQADDDRHSRWPHADDEVSL